MSDKPVRGFLLLGKTTAITNVPTLGKVCLDCAEVT